MCLIFNQKLRDLYLNFLLFSLYVYIIASHFFQTFSQLTSKNWKKYLILIKEIIIPTKDIFRDIQWIIFHFPVFEMHCSCMVIKLFIFPTGKRKIDTFANYSKFGFNETLRKSMVFVKSKFIPDVNKGYFFVRILSCYSETSVPGTR